MKLEARGSDRLITYMTLGDLCFKSSLNQNEASGGILRNTAECRNEVE